MKSMFAAMTLTVLLATAGCSTPAEKATPAAGGSSPAAKAAGCTAGEFKDPGGVYCIMIPAGYTSTGPKQTIDDAFQDAWIADSGYSFHVDSWPVGGSRRTLEDLKTSFAATHGSMTLVESSGIDNGGIYERLHNPESGNDTVRSATQSGGRVVECQETTNDPAAAADACRTLRAQH